MTPEKKFQLQNVSGDTISSYKMSGDKISPETFILDNMPFTYNMSPETYK